MRIALPLLLLVLGLGFWCLQRGEQASVITRQPEVLGGNEIAPELTLAGAVDVSQEPLVDPAPRAPVESAEETPADGRFSDEPTTTLTGRVIWPEGFRDMQLSVCLQRGRFKRLLPVKQDGSYRLEGVRRGPCTISALLAAQFGDNSIGHISIEIPEVEFWTAPDFDISQLAKRITVLVTDPRGEHIPGAIGALQFPLSRADLGQCGQSNTDLHALTRTRLVRCPRVRIGSLGEPKRWGSDCLELGPGHDLGNHQSRGSPSSATRALGACGGSI